MRYSILNSVVVLSCSVAFFSTPPLASTAQAGVVPWTYNAIFGYGPIFPRRYSARYGMTYPVTYGANYGYIAPRTYFGAPAAPYATYYAPSYSSWRPQYIGTGYGGCGCVPCQCNPCGTAPCGSGPCSVENGNSYSPNPGQASEQQPQTFENQKPEQNTELEDDFEKVPQRSDVSRDSATSESRTDAPEWARTGSEPSGETTENEEFVGPSVDLGGEIGDQGSANANTTESPSLPSLGPPDRLPVNAEPSSENQNFDEEEPVIPSGIPGVRVEPLEVESTAVTSLVAIRRRVSVVSTISDSTIARLPRPLASSSRSQIAAR